MEHDSIQFDSPLPVVEAWQDAANRRDIGRLLELSNADIEISGPEGTIRGREALRDWLGRAPAPLKTIGAFVRGETVVLAQQAAEPSSGIGASTGEGDLASRYRVSEGQVVEVSRYDAPDAALADAGLDASDEMKAF